MLSHAFDFSPTAPKPILPKKITQIIKLLHLEVMLLVQKSLSHCSKSVIKKFGFQLGFQDLMMDRASSMQN